MAVGTRMNQAKIMKTICTITSLLLLFRVRLLVACELAPPTSLGVTGVALPVEPEDDDAPLYGLVRSSVN